MTTDPAALAKALESTNARLLAAEAVIEKASKIAEDMPTIADSMVVERLQDLFDEYWEARRDSVFPLWDK